MNLLQIGREERITAIIPVQDFSEDSGYLIMCTSNGFIKKTSLADYSNISRSGILAISLDDDDDLMSVQHTGGNHEIFIATRQGMGIRFNEDQIRTTGRVTRGVRAIKLKSNDKVVTMDYIDQGTEVLILTENGIGKRTALEEYRQQDRYGRGVIATRVNKRTGPVVKAKVIIPGSELIVTTTNGYVIRMTSDDISVQSRATQGVIVVRLEPDDIVTNFAVIPTEEENGD